MRPDPFATISVTFREAPSAVRERLAAPLSSHVWDGLRVQGGDGLVCVHTCQRSLWILSGDEPAWVAQLLRAHLERRVPEAPLAVRVGDAAVRHVLEVAAGLDAFVQGEADVGAQVTGAFADARSTGTDGVRLRVFARVVAELRREGRREGFIRPTRGVAQLAVAALAGVPRDEVVAVVGAGAIGGRVVEALRRSGFPAPIVYNRSAGRGLRGLDEVTRHAAIVVCTAGPERWFHPPPGTRVVVDVGLPRQVAGAAVDLDALLAGPDLRLDAALRDSSERAVIAACARLNERVRARRHGLAEAARLRQVFVAEQLDELLEPATRDLSPAQGRRVRQATERALRRYNHEVVAWLREG